MQLDKVDQALIAHLRRDGRASLSNLAGYLGVTRATVRARLDRLVETGEIVGFTVTTRSDAQPDPVRGLMMLAIDGRGTERVMRHLTRMQGVAAVHSTNGTWDLIVELATGTLDALDQVLFDIRRLEGVSRSETNLLLSTRR